MWETGFIWFWDEEGLMLPDRGRCLYNWKDLGEEKAKEGVKTSYGSISSPMSFLEMNRFVT